MLPLLLGRRTMPTMETETCSRHLYELHLNDTRDAISALCIIKKEKKRERNAVIGPTNQANQSEITRRGKVLFLLPLSNQSSKVR